MKTLRNLVMIMLLTSITTLSLKAEAGAFKCKNAPNDSLQSLKVEGNCEMCKSRIEKAALEVKGVKSASWDIETHFLTLNINQGTKVDDVALAIANAGHDNEKHKTTDKIYKALPKCCQYRN